MQNLSAGGYNMALFVGKSRDEFEKITCGICLEVYRDPKQCFRGHIYCNSCIDSLPNVGGGKNCPECREATDRWSSNLFVQNHVESITVQCISKIDGKKYSHTRCDWQGCLGNLEHHVRNECQLTVVTCKLAGCGAEMIRASLEAHEQQCLFQLTKCVHCGCEVTFHAQAGHQANCGSRPVSCDQNCGASIALNQFESHKRNDCPNTLIVCPLLKLVGTCSSCACLPNDNVGAKFRRSSLSGHLTTDPQTAGENIMTLLKQLDGAQRTNDALRADLHASHIATKLKVFITTLKHAHQSYACNHTNIRWEHASKLYVMLIRWLSEWESSGDHSSITKVATLLCGTPLQNHDIVVRRCLAIEFELNEFYTPQFKCESSIHIANTMTLKVTITRDSGALYKATVSTAPEEIPMCNTTVSVVRLGAKSNVPIVHFWNVSFQKHGFRGTCEIGGDAGELNDGSTKVRLLFSALLSKVEFRQFGILLHDGGEF